MKKPCKSLLFLLNIGFLSLVGCSSNQPSEPKEEGNNQGGNEEQTQIVLQEDKNENYVFDKVDNSTGSMSYEIFVRSFYDSDKDGIGDFNGITQNLDYLKDLGIKTIWLMPIMPSPSYHGYDVSDYFNVNPDYGTLSDFDNLVKSAEDQGIDIMIDMVLNHCSTENDYFKDSFIDYLDNNTSADSMKDWFNWSNKSQSGYQEYRSGKYYECRFDRSMPDFNLDSPAVRNEIDKMCKFWIKDHKVKGFRLDAVLYYYQNDVNKNVDFLNFLSETTKKYDKDFYMVGEAWTNDLILERYYNSKCESFFAFDNATGGELNSSIIQAAKNFNSPKKFTKTIELREEGQKKLNPNGYSSYFLSNHDQDRCSSSFTKGEIYNKVAASIYGLLPGTPFMYYGEEISMVGDRSSSPDDFSDVKRRLPMIWSSKDKIGQCQFPEQNRKDLDTTVQVKSGVFDKLSENYSLLNHYKKVINVRNKYPFIKNANFKSIVSDIDYEENVLVAYKLYDDNNEIYVITNVGEENIEIKAVGSQIVDSINTAKLIPELKDGKLKIGAHSTVILK